MNSDLITKLNRLLEFIKHWQPDIRLSGVVDYGTLCSSSSLHNILRQVILALRAEGKDGLASQLEDDWTVFASDTGERDSKDYSTSSKSERDIFRMLTDEQGIRLDKEMCPRDVMYKVFSIAKSKQNLIETITTTLRVMQAAQKPASSSGDGDGFAAKKEAIEQKGCWHNQDFTSIVWYGTSFTFNKTQGLCIGYLWENERASQESIGEHIACSTKETYRLRDTFRSKKNGVHEAWGKVIKSHRNGTFSLNRPKGRPPKNTP